MVREEGDVGGDMIQVKWYNRVDGDKHGYAIYRGNLYSFIEGKGEIAFINELRIVDHVKSMNSFYNAIKDIDMLDIYYEEDIDKLEELMFKEEI